MQPKELDGVKKVVVKFIFHDSALTSPLFPPHQKILFENYRYPDCRLVVPSERRDLSGMREALTTLGYRLRPEVIADYVVGRGYLSRFVFSRREHPGDTLDQETAFDALTADHSWRVMAERADSRLWVRCITPLALAPPVVLARAA